MTTKPNHIVLASAFVALGLIAAAEGQPGMGLACVFIGTLIAGLSAIHSRQPRTTDTKPLPRNYYASCVVPDGSGRYLTMHHSKKAQHPWRFPGGKINRGELPIAAAARELFEEMGIIAEGMMLVAVHTTAVDGAEWTGYYYLVDKYEGSPGITEPAKHDDWAYMSGDTLKLMNAHPEHTVVTDLEAAFEEAKAQDLL